MHVAAPKNKTKQNKTTPPKKKIQDYYYVSIRKRQRSDKHLYHRNGSWQKIATSVRKQYRLPCFQPQHKPFFRVTQCHSGQSTHFKGWGFEIFKNCKRVGVHIFPLKRVDWYKGWKQTIKGGVLQTSKLCTYTYKTKLKK